MDSPSSCGIYGLATSKARRDKILLKLHRQPDLCLGEIKKKKIQRVHTTATSSTASISCIVYISLYLMTLDIIIDIDTESCMATTTQHMSGFDPSTGTKYYSAKLPVWYRTTLGYDMFWLQCIFGKTHHMQGLLGYYYTIITAPGESPAS